MLSSIVWFIIPGMKNAPGASVTVALIVQEAFRYLFFRLYVKTERVLKPKGGRGALSSRFQAALAIGVGNGAIYVLLMYTSLLWEATGPATMFSDSCPGTDLFIVNAVLACCFAFLHVFQSILAFDGFQSIETRQGKAIIAATVLSHAFASFATLLHHCAISIVAVLIVTIVTGVLTARLVVTKYAVAGITLPANNRPRSGSKIISDR